jgi:hypothetical protein
MARPRSGRIEIRRQSPRAKARGDCRRCISAPLAQSAGPRRGAAL